MSSAPPNSPTATKSQPQRQPHPKDGRQREGAAKGSNQEPSPEAQPAERPGGRKEKDAKHPTGRKTGRLSKGIAKATPAAQHPQQTRREGHRRGFRDFPLHTTHTGTDPTTQASASANPRPRRHMVESRQPTRRPERARTPLLRQPPR